MNFDQTGNVTSCCFNRTHVLGNYPKQSLHEIWTGNKAAALRSAMKHNSFALGCQQCERMIDEGNEESVLIKHFDDYYAFLPEAPSKITQVKNFLLSRKSSILPAPAVFEFELSNTCNLECIMCGGKWSSAIRNNREKLPVIKNPYDDNFVLQLKDFLPTLKRANFLGGEPFLISIYYNIWETIIEVNPAIDVAITSNGTLINDRAKNIIDKLPNCRITLSIDSLVAATWEKIRVNGKFETLKKNIDYLLNTGKLMSFSVCPIIQNRMEIPAIVSFCVKNNLDIYFNIVYEPLGGRLDGIHQKPGGMPSLEKLIPETSLQFLPADELSELIAFYQTFSFPGRQQQQFKSLIEQLKTWQRAKQIHHAV